MAIASSVTGVRGCRPEHVVLRNFEIECVGAGVSDKPFCEPGEETAGCYPEANMFRDYRLPCYGLYVDQADDVKTENLNFSIRTGTGDSRASVYFSKR